MWVSFSMASVLQIPILFTFACIMLFDILGWSFLSSIAVFVMAYFANKVIMKNI